MPIACETCKAEQESTAHLARHLRDMLACLEVIERKCPDADYMQAWHTDAVQVFLTATEIAAIRAVLAKTKT